MGDFANAIARLCINKYDAMKKTGKPGNNEWTVLSGIILKDANDKFSLVSLATGTKCLGGVELTNGNFYDIGDKLSDSHAEILARRGFLLYLYDQIDLLLSTGNSQVFIMNTETQIETKPGLSFHFYCSQTPCGDCSIIPMNPDEIFYGNRLAKKQKIADDASESNSVSIEEKSKSIRDTHRTGAKCLATERKRDLYLSGTNYHVTGPLRTKPGRGDPTLSLSCSDKMAKWNAIGIQGALLSFFVSPLRLKTIVIGGECPFSHKAMERGLYKRFGDDIAGPNILQADVSFLHKRNSIRSHPCPSSIMWCAIRDKSTEITVEGRKQGATRNRKGNHLLVSRRAFLRKFLETVDKYPSIKNVPLHPKKIYYYHCKQSSEAYQKEWKKLKTTRFTAWPEKPANLQNFCL